MSESEVCDRDIDEKAERPCADIERDEDSFGEDEIVQDE